MSPPSTNDLPGMIDRKGAMKSPWSAGKWRLLPATLLFLAVLLYVAVRSAQVPFTWDEAYSYLHHVRDGVFWPVDKGAMGANHHPLNVWGMILADRGLGNSEWQLRLPSVLAFVLYGAAALWMLRKVRNGVRVLFVLALLVLHPYVLDLFSLARGYALGMGWMMVSLVMAREHVLGGRRWCLPGAMFAAGLAAISNLSWLNFLVALPPALLLLEARRGSPLRAIVPSVIIPAAFLAVLLPLAAGLRHGGALYFGSGDVREMVESIAWRMLYLSNDLGDPPTLLLRALLAVSVLVVIALVLGVRKKDPGSWRPLLLPVLVLLFWGASIFVQHLWMQVPLPYAPTGVGLVVLVVFCGASALLVPALGRRVPVVVGLLAFLPLAYLQARAFNTRHCVEWPISHELRGMLATIKADGEWLLTERPFFTVNCGYESWMPMRYYKESRGMQEMQVMCMVEAVPLYAATFTSWRRAG